MHLPSLACLSCALVVAGCAGTPTPTGPAPVPFSTVITQVPTFKVQQPKECTKPAYPPDDLLSRHSGVSVIGFLVDPDGWVRDTKVIKSSGYRGLDSATAYALRHCRFKPTLKDGKAVEAWQPVDYRWVIE